MVATYDSWLVILSIVVAVIASYVALDLASRVAATHGSRAARYWLGGGALSMGTGIWSMHFIGMLAFRLPLAMAYDVTLTALSLVIAVCVSGFALYTVSHGALQTRRLLGAGLLMGLGIAGMHYTGMAAMEMSPPIRYDPLLFTLSIVIAIAASLVALWIAFQFRLETILSAFWKKAGSALAMGAAIAGMHYTAMAAAIFAADSVCLSGAQNIDNVWLGSAIGVFAFMLLTITLLVSAFDARLADRSARLAATLREANLRLQQEMQERARAGDALLESEARYRQLVEMSQDAICIQCDGRFAFINGAGIRMLGANVAEDLIGRPVLDYVHPDYVDLVTARVGQVLECRLPLAPIEARLIRADGTVVDVELMESFFVHRGLPAVQSVVRDISERKHAERQLLASFAELKTVHEHLQETQSQLLQSEKMASLGQLAAGVAHEINNPIGFVNSNLNTLLEYVEDILRLIDGYQQIESSLPAVRRDEIARLKRQVDIDSIRGDIVQLVGESREGTLRVMQIVRDLKGFSHAGDDQSWQRTDLHVGLDRTLNIVRNELKYKAQVVKEYGALPEIECLPSQLNQVFMNLLVNAGQAITAPGKVVVSTGHSGQSVWIKIRDTGSGIAPENLKRIFDPFFTTKPVGQGTGLGLSVSYGIIAKHHGRIEVDSAPGEGTTFSVWLPIKQSSHAAAAG